MITPVTTTAAVEISNSKNKGSNTIDTTTMSKTNETAKRKLEYFHSKKKKMKMNNNKKKKKSKKKHMPPTLEISFTTDDTASITSLGTLASSFPSDKYCFSSTTISTSSSSSSDDSDYISSSSDSNTKTNNYISTPFCFQFMNKSNNSIGDSNNNNSNMNEKKKEEVADQFNNDDDVSSSSTSSSSSSTSTSILFEPSSSPSQFHIYYSHYDPITKRITIRRRIENKLDDSKKDQEGEGGCLSFWFLDKSGRQDMCLNNFLCDIKEFFLGMKPSLLSRSTNNEEKKNLLRNIMEKKLACAH